MQEPKFDQAEFRRTLERMQQGQDFGDTNPTPAFDGKLRDEMVEAAIAGRKIEDYKVGLEASGFRFIPHLKLPPYKNGVPHKEGEWRNPKLRMAFTDKEILAGFQTPEEFVTWIENYTKAKRLKAAGLLLGTKMRRRR